MFITLFLIYLIVILYHLIINKAVFNKWLQFTDNLPILSHKAVQGKASTPLISNSPERVIHLGSLRKESLTFPGQKVQSKFWLKAKGVFNFVEEISHRHQFWPWVCLQKLRLEQEQASSSSPCMHFWVVTHFPCLCSIDPSSGSYVYKLVSRSGHRIVGRMWQDWERRTSPETLDVDLELISVFMGHGLSLFDKWVNALFFFYIYNHMRVRTGGVLLCCIFFFLKQKRGKQENYWYTIIHELMMQTWT